MKCFLVTFTVEENGGIHQRLIVFHADSIPDLTEKICEFQEEWERESDVIIISKEVKEIS